MKDLLGEENWKRTTRPESELDDGRGPEGPDEAAVVVQERDKKGNAAQQKQATTNNENVHLAVQNFEKYGKQYFKKKF